MKNIVDYLFIFIATVMFLPNNNLTIVYIVCNFLVLITYFIIYLKRDRKGEEKKNFEINLNLITVLIMLVVVNLFVKLENTNLIFGFAVLSTFIIHILNSIIKKENITARQFLNPNYIFDFYSIIYISNLFMILLNSEV